MFPIKLAPPWELHRRIRLIETYMKAVNRYFENIEHFEHLGHHCIENDEAVKARVEILRMQPKMLSVLEAARRSSEVRKLKIGDWQNRTYSINVIVDPLKINLLKLAPVVVFDSLVVLQAVHEDRLTMSWFNLVNPFYWLSLVVEVLSNSLSQAVGSIVGSPSSLRQSRIWMLSELLIKGVTFVVAVLKMFEQMGWLPIIQGYLSVLS